MFRRWHSSFPAAQRGQSCGFGVTAGSMMRPVLPQTAQQHRAQAWGIPTSHPNPASPAIQRLPGMQGWSCGVCRVTQANLAVNSATAITQPVSLTRGQFRFLQGVIPGPHSFTFCLQASVALSHAADSHMSHSSSRPCCLPCWMSSDSSHKEGML